MIRKKKICTECGNESYIFSRRRCKSCSVLLYGAPKRTNKKSLENNAYYLKAWDSHKTKKCEECDKELPEFNPCYISHIVSKGSNTALRCDIKNHLLLCFGCHQIYEFGDRKKMRTYKRAAEVKIQLIREYYEVK